MLYDCIYLELHDFVQTGKLKLIFFQTIDNSTFDNIFQTRLSATCTAIKARYPNMLIGITIDSNVTANDLGKIK